MVCATFTIIPRCYVRHGSYARRKCQAQQQLVESDQTEKYRSCLDRGSGGSNPLLVHRQQSSCFLCILRLKYQFCSLALWWLFVKRGSLLDVGLFPRCLHADASMGPSAQCLPNGWATWKSIILRSEPALTKGGIAVYSDRCKRSHSSTGVLHVNCFIY